MFVNKHFINTDAHISKRKRCYNVKPSTYCFCMGMKIPLNFRICIYFFKKKSSEKTLCSLHHSIRSHKDAVFVAGDVYYKKNDCKRQKGPAKVTGVDSHQILVKHVSFYVDPIPLM